jgi:DNA polymerase III alpha subunit (gram-positive type)
MMTPDAETVFDIETDGLLDKLTKIHVLSYQTSAMDEPRSIFDYDEMRDFFLEYSLDHTLALAGHNIVRFDVPAVEKVLGIKIRAKLVDTLGLSWYLHHQRQKHGLAVYGEEYGVPKPKVDDWEGLSKEEYAHRCEEDVKINVRLWRDLKRKLEKLYEQ